MKISFSTLGCPDWTWSEIMSAAVDLGYDGIELRGVENVIYIPDSKYFKDDALSITLNKMTKHNLTFSCLTSSSYLFDKKIIDKSIKEGFDYIDLAVKTDCPYVRVLGDENPQPRNDIDIDFVCSNLKTLVEYAQKNNICVLLETNGVFASSKTAYSVLEKIGSKSLGILWDVHHPYRYFGESAEDTYKVLKDSIKHVHIKDSVTEDGKVKYKMTTYGDVPVKQAVQILQKNGYSGFVSLEWVKRWNYELEDPGIVFSHYINTIKSII